MTTTEMQSLLDALKRARYSGLRSLSQGNISMSWGSDAELEMKINALQGEINALAATPAPRASLASFSRG